MKCLLVLLDCLRRSSSSIYVVYKPLYNNTGNILSVVSLKATSWHQCQFVTAKESSNSKNPNYFVLLFIVNYRHVYQLFVYLPIKALLIKI